jgi:hypothetical protein
MGAALFSSQSPLDLRAINGGLDRELRTIRSDRRVGGAHYARMKRAYLYGKLLAVNRSMLVG